MKKKKLIDLSEETVEKLKIISKENEMLLKPYMEKILQDFANFAIPNLKAYEKTLQKENKR